MTDCQYKITIRLKEPIENNGTWITYVNVPCGKCPRCLERRKMEWAFRIQEEMKQSKTAYFATLTYSPEYVPINKYGIKTLVPTRQDDLKHRLFEQGRKRITRKWKKEQEDRSLEGFWKRLRINQERGTIHIEHLVNKLKNDDKIKYFACGEYGEERHRPHYHAIIFNTSKRNIEHSWPYGTCHIVKANEQTVSYLLKYLDKHLGKKQDWRKEPEFNTMSEGIGYSYIERNQNWHKKNIDILYVTNNKGIKIPMPKIFRLQMFNEEQRKEQIKIVENTLSEIKEDRINEIGIDAYNEEQSMIKYQDELRFNKKIKKRKID